MVFNEDDCYILRFPTSDAVRVVLSGLFCYVNTQCKSEIRRAEKGVLKKRKFSTEEGQMVIPFEIELIKIKNGMECERQPITMNYSVRKLRVEGNAQAKSHIKENEPEIVPQIEPNSSQVPEDRTFQLNSDILLQFDRMISNAIEKKLTHFKNEIISTYQIPPNQTQPRKKNPSKTKRNVKPTLSNPDFSKTE